MRSMAIEDLAPFDRLNSPRAFDFSEEGERLRSAFEDLSDLSPEHLDDPIETFTSQAEPIESFSSQDNETDQNATSEKQDQNATTDKRATTEQDQNATPIWRISIATFQEEADKRGISFE